MVPVDLAAILTTLAMLHLFFRKDIPAGLGYGVTESAGHGDKRSGDVPYRLGRAADVAGLAFSFLTRWGSRSAPSRRREPGSCLLSRSAGG